MSERAIHLEGDSPHAVAYMLLMSIAISEGKSVSSGYIKADRQWLLSTYAQCLEVAEGGEAP